ncbi:MAG: hypothetical protein GY943_00290 [Chloroflexi bacterium]|nr:hypothetical protein [Chloroflexota bacterium]
MLNKKILFFVFIGFMIVGCSSAPKYADGDLLLTEEFSDVNAWEQYVDEDNGVVFQVINGMYQVKTEDGGYIWGLNEQNHTDVIMEVTSTQISSYENNAYGIMCRADPSNNGDGYYFLISGDGFYSIAMGAGEDVNSLVDWKSSSAIEKGTSSNTLRAVCLGSSLYFYVNDRLVAETEDTTYSSGYAGFVGTALDGGDIEVNFDSLTIKTALPPAAE